MKTYYTKTGIPLTLIVTEHSERIEVSRAISRIDEIYEQLDRLMLD